MSEMTRRRRISVPSTAAYARLKRILPCRYDTGANAMTAKLACSTRPCMISTSRSIPSLYCLSAMSKGPNPVFAPLSPMMDAAPTNVDTTKKPDTKKITWLVRSDASMASANRCAHSRWWNITTAAFTTSPYVNTT